MTDTSCEMMEMGGRFICYGADIWMIKQGLEQIQREYTTIGLVFDNQINALDTTKE